MLLMALQGQPNSASFSVLGGAGKPLLPARAALRVRAGPTPLGLLLQAWNRNMSTRGEMKKGMDEYLLFCRKC